MPQVHLRDDGIVVIEFGRDPDLDTASLLALHEQRMAIAPGRHPILLLLGAHFPMPVEGAGVSTEAAVTDTTSAVALVGGWAMTGWMTELHVIQHQVPYPMRHFADQDEAIAWLLQYV